MTDPAVLLLNEKLQRTLDLLDSRLNRLLTNQQHQIDMLNKRVETLENNHSDQETRLRAVAETLIRLNTQGSLAAIGQSMLSLILAAIAAYIGAR